LVHLRNSKQRALMLKVNRSRRMNAPISLRASRFAVALAPIAAFSSLQLASAPVRSVAHHATQMVAGKGDRVIDQRSLARTFRLYRRIVCLVSQSPSLLLVAVL
jgi:hypothetical protein